MSKEKEFEMLMRKLRQDELARRVYASGLTMETYQALLRWKWLFFKVELPDGTTFDTAEIIEGVVRWLRGEWRDRPFLCFYGGRGTGKTMLAKRILVEFIRRNTASVFYIDKKQFDLQLFDFNVVDEFIKYLCNVDVLCIDDIGTGHETEYKSAHLFTVLNHRYEENKRTIITSNHDPRRVKGDETTAQGVVKDIILLADRLKEKGMFIHFPYPSLRDEEMRKQAESGLLRVPRNTERFIGEVDV